MKIKLRIRILQLSQSGSRSGKAINPKSTSTALVMIEMICRAENQSYLKQTLFIQSLQEVGEVVHNPTRHQVFNTNRKMNGFAQINHNLSDKILPVFWHETAITHSAVKDLNLYHTRMGRICFIGQEPIIGYLFCSL